jgi:hypothetical protein
MYLVKEFSFDTLLDLKFLDNTDYFRGRLIADKEEKLLTLIDNSSNCVALVKTNNEVQKTMDYLEVVNSLFRF